MRAALDAMHDESVAMFTAAPPTLRTPIPLTALTPSQVERIKQTSPIYAMFGGVVHSAVTCNECSYRSNRFDPFLDVSLAVTAGITDVKGAISHFTRPERLDNANRYRCNNCQRKVSASKRLLFYSAPQTFCLHLKRFEYAHSRGGKIGKHIHFTDTLDMKPFMSALAADADQQYEYRLYAVLVHSGASIHSGHYYSFVRALNGTDWLLCDDATVRPVNRETVFKSNAYILFYNKQQSKIQPQPQTQPQPQPQPQPQVQRSTPAVARPLSLSLSPSPSPFAVDSGRLLHLSSAAVVSASIPTSSSSPTSSLLLSSASSAPSPGAVRRLKRRRLSLVLPAMPTPISSLTMQPIYRRNAAKRIRRQSAADAPQISNGAPLIQESSPPPPPPPIPTPTLLPPASASSVTNVLCRRGGMSISRWSGSSSDTVSASPAPTIDRARDDWDRQIDTPKPRRCSRNGNEVRAEVNGARFNPFQSAAASRHQQRLPIRSASAAGAAASR